MSELSLVAFDADDTLWHNLKHFDAAEQEFGVLLSAFVPDSEAVKALQAAERSNLKLYGFGVKSFTLSMIETAISLSQGKVGTATLSRMIEIARFMLSHEIELLPHVEATLEQLRPDFKLLLITKGDLYHQERKVVQSGLSHYFHGIEIVSDKTADVYAKICQRHDSKPERSLMAGNSIRSDILPMIAAGGYGVYVPHDIIWDHEHEDVPQGTDRFYEVEDVRGVIEVVQRIKNA